MFSRRNVVHILPIFLLIVLLSGCQSDQQEIATLTVPPSATGTATPEPTPSSTPNQFLISIPSISFDEYNLIVSYGTGFPRKYLALSPDGHTVASLGYSHSDNRSLENCIFLWDMHSIDQSMAAFESPIKYPGSIVFSHNGNLIAIGNSSWGEHRSQSQVAIIDWRAASIVQWIDYRGLGIMQMEFSKDDSKLFIRDDGYEKLSLLDLKDSSVLASVELSTNIPSPNNFSLSSQGNMIAVENNEKSSEIRLLDTETFSVLETRVGPGPGFLNGVSFAFSPDGTWLAAGGCGELQFEMCSTGQIYLWEQENTNSARVLSGAEGSVIALKFSTDGIVLAAGNYYGLTLYKTSSGAIIPSGFSDYDIQIYDILFSSENDTFVVSSNVGIVLGEVAPDHSSWEYTTLDSLGIGRTFYVTDIGDNRTATFYNEQTNDPITSTLKQGEKIKIIGGPFFRDGNAWWNLESAEDGKYLGWVIEIEDMFSPLPTR